MDNRGHVTSRLLKSTNFCSKKLFQSEIRNPQQILMFCSFGRPTPVSGTCGSLYLRQCVQNMTVVVVYSHMYRRGKIQF